MTTQSTFRPVEVPVRQKGMVDPLAIDGGPGADEIPDEAPANASTFQKAATLMVILIPFIGVVTAIALLWGWGFTWVHLAIMGVGYVLSGFGITVGYHRLFTHKSFETNRFITATLGILGSMAWQGSLINWVQNHRCHHQHSDREHDPHSPHLHGEGFKAWVKGALFAHMGWFFTPDPKGMERYAPDLHADRMIRIISKLFPLWAALGVVIPGLIAWAITQTWQGLVLGMLWGGLTRVFLLHHVTWSVNSVCHLWGSKTYRSHDESRNNAIFGILALGEGWHNNHHAFPASARHGLAWWQFDASYILIKTLEKLGLASNVKVPDRSRLESKRVRPAA
jgi:stearoyl-CoA desaturase (delta-9 desaturase)